MPKKRKSNKKLLFYFVDFLIVVLFIIAAIFVYSIGSTTLSQAKLDEKNNEILSTFYDDSKLLTVHYFDVGQGDCEFIELPNGQTMLIDSGELYTADSTIKKIKRLGYTKIDYVIATHPHDDHIGGMQKIVSEFDIGEFYMPKLSTDTDNYISMLRALKEKNENIYIISAGDIIFDYDDYNLTAKCLAPSSTYYERENDYSAVMKITYNQKSFLFSGDAESTSETEMVLNYKNDLNSDVLKVGHHGSYTSSTQSYLDAVSPTFAVISVGSGNDYGHPADETVSRIKNSGIPLFRTDQNGDITFETDGNNIIYNLEKTNTIFL